MRILAFAPHSAIWIHAFPEGLVLDAARQQGCEILYVGCGGVLRSHCVSMSGCGVPFEASSSAKSAVCRSCNNNVRIIRKHFGFAYKDLASVISDVDVTEAAALASSLNPSNCRDFVVDGIEIGRIAPYELLIQNKKANLTFTEEEWGRYLASVKNTILSMRAVGRIIDEFRPDAVTVYNALYSVNRVVCRLCERRGVRQYFIHAGDNLARRLGTVIVAKDQAFSYYAHLRKHWNIVKDAPCAPTSMSRATDHFLEVLRGKSPWAYSVAPTAGRDLRREFGIANDAAVICAAMSSEDERVSSELIGVQAPAKQQLYATQVEWIGALIHYVSTKPDKYLIVRLHPREFPNKREGVLSEHARRLKDVLSELPANVRINWPSDGVSLYDLANITDVFLNAWSSAGKEMAWLGLPVVLYSSALTLYPSDLNYLATTEPEYFATIERALGDGWDPERIRRTYRWCAIEYDRALLDISESFRGQENASRLTKGVRAVIGRVASSRYQERDCRRRAKSLNCAKIIGRVFAEELQSVVDLHATTKPPALVEETRCLRAEVKRLCLALYGGSGRGRSASGAIARQSLEHRLRRFCGEIG